MPASLHHPAGSDQDRLAAGRLPLSFVLATPQPGAATGGLFLPEDDLRFLFARLGPSLGLWRAAEVAALREQLPILEPPVLDLGCGDGLVTSLVLPYVAVGLDPEHGALGRAARLGVYRRLQPLPVEEAPLPAGSFGSVLSNSVLEHVPEIDRVLAAAARLLQPGGRLVMTAPTESFGRWLLLPPARYAAWRNRQLGHRNLWTVEQWQARLAAVGLQVTAVRPYLRRSLVAAWDALELLQQLHVGRRRLFGMMWRRLPPPFISALARRAARLDLASPAPGGGRLIVATRVDA